MEVNKKGQNSRKKIIAPYERRELDVAKLIHWQISQIQKFNYLLQILSKTSLREFAKNNTEPVAESSCQKSGRTDQPERRERASSDGSRWTAAYRRFFLFVKNNLSSAQTMEPQETKKKEKKPPRHTKKVVRRRYE